MGLKIKVLLKALMGLGVCLRPPSAGLFGGRYSFSNNYYTTKKKILNPKPSTHLEAF